jgi:epoxide hydrolase-like predicted phosphatase
MQYKAVGFDYGGVIKGRPGSLFSASVVELLGVTKKQYQEAYYRHNKKVNRGEVTWSELWKLVLTDLGQPDKVKAVMELSNSVFDQSINQDVLDFVDRIRSMDYRVGLLSNNTIEAGQKMRELGVDKHFDVFHVSAETQLVKPEVEAFAHFARELDVAPSELVFVDDAEKSLSTAEECGFTPILFESYEQLVQDLANLGVL